MVNASRWHHERPKQNIVVYFYGDWCGCDPSVGWGVRDLNKAFEDVAHRTVAELFDMLKEAIQERDKLKAEIVDLVAFNTNLDRERNRYRDDARKYAKKVQMIANLFVVPSDDHQTTIKAIKTILEQVGGGCEL